MSLLASGVASILDALWLVDAAIQSLPPSSHSILLSVSISNWTRVFFITQCDPFSLEYTYKDLFPNKVAC